MKRLIVALLLTAAVGMNSLSVASGQSVAPATPAAKSPPAPTATSSATTADAERAKIWDSPEMLRARAWLQEHDATSVKVTPEEAKEHQAELANLSAKQMKLFLLKFQHEEEIRQQEHAAFNLQRQGDVQRAMAMNQQLKQSYANVNADANQAAATAESSITQEQQFAQQDGLQKSDARASTVNNLLTRPIVGGYGYGGFGGGGVHYHFY